MSKKYYRREPNTLHGQNHITDSRCIGFEKQIQDFHEYGSFPEFDSLVDSSDIRMRVRAARLGYGVDKLKDDSSIRVRKAVADGGYYPQQFIKDSSPLVVKSARKFIRI